MREASEGMLSGREEEEEEGGGRENFPRGDGRGTLSQFGFLPSGAEIGTHLNYCPLHRPGLVSNGTQVWDVHFNVPAFNGNGKRINAAQQRPVPFLVFLDKN